VGKVSHVRALTPNFTVVTLKMWAYMQPPKIAKIGNFWYKFDQKGYTPLSDIYKIWLGEEVPGPHPHAKFHRCGCRPKNVGLQPQNREKGNFWYKGFP